MTPLDDTSRYGTRSRGTHRDTWAEAHGHSTAAAELPLVEAPAPPLGIPRGWSSPPPENGAASLASIVAAGQRRASVFRRLLAVADLSAAVAALVVAVVLLGDDRLTVAGSVLPFAVIAIGKLLGLYDRDELVVHKATLDDAPGVFQVATLYPGLVWLLEAAVVEGALQKFQLLMLGVTTFVGILAMRAIARTFASRIAGPESCLLLGDAEAFSRVEGKLNLSGPTGTRLVARYDVDDDERLRADQGALHELVTAHGVERIILAPKSTDSDAVLELIREAKETGVKVSLMPRVSEVLGSSVVFDDLHGMTLLALKRFGLTKSSLALKRGFDLVVGGVTAVAIAPLVAVIALAVKLDSRGPLLFRQARIGRNGRPFQMVKFRTMVEGADEQKAELAALNEANGLFKIADDPRITRVGRWLRRTSLDELPQLFNVLRGDMSLVGPRPLVEEDDRRIVGRYRDRLNLTPGMTGHWQILGSARIPLHEMVAIDYLYIVNWSLWTDFKYLLRTVPYILTGRGL